MNNDLKIFLFHPKTDSIDKPNYIIRTCCIDHAWDILTDETSNYANYKHCIQSPFNTIEQAQADVELNYSGGAIVLDYN